MSSPGSPDRSRRIAGRNRNGGGSLNPDDFRRHRTGVSSLDDRNQNLFRYLIFSHRRIRDFQFVMESRIVVGSENANYVFEHGQFVFKSDKKTGSRKAVQGRVPTKDVAIVEIPRPAWEMLHHNTVIAETQLQKQVFSSRKWTMTSYAPGVPLERCHSFDILPES